MSISLGAETAAAEPPFPPLPLDGWKETKETLHRFVQIVGKIRLATSPPRNHWCHVPLYGTTRGLTTSPIPYGDRSFAIDFDFIDHRLVITTSAGSIATFPLAGRSVARFHEDLFERLAALGIDVAILAKPYALSDARPFASDTAHASYDPTYVHRF